MLNESGGELNNNRHQTSSLHCLPDYSLSITSIATKPEIVAFASILWFTSFTSLCHSSWQRPCAELPFALNLFEAILRPLSLGPAS